MTSKNLPLKAGLLIVALAYFLFTLHGLFTLQWIGEWSRGQIFRFATFTEDISATAGTVFRFAAATIALASIIYYFTRGLPSKSRLFKLLRVIVVFEGIYWLGLSTSAMVDFNRLVGLTFGGGVTLTFLGTFTLYVISEIVESIVLPIVLFVLAYKLSVNKPLRGAVKWALIAAVVYVVTFWLVNSSLWLLTVSEGSVGWSYLTAYPQNFAIFAITAFGMLSLAIYTACTAKKSDSAKILSLKNVGVVVFGLGMFFLWNYASWVFFGYGKWSDWYALFLGHNFDLWMLTLPLVGLPMLFMDDLKLD